MTMAKDIHVPEPTDMELLTQYAGTNSHAIEVLIRRHADWVYAAALRMTHDRTQAEDVTQGVLWAMTRKAKALSRRKSIGGWLFEATRYAVATVKRSERRQKERERMPRELPPPIGPDETLAWEEIKEKLDDAVARLPAVDRDLILMRFYQRLSHEDAARAMGLTPEAARKRLARALEKLRGVLGVGVAVGVLTVALSSAPLEAAPAHVIGGVLLGKISPQATLLAKGVSIMVKGIQLKMAIAAAVLVAGGGCFVIAQAFGQGRQPPLTNQAGGGSSMSFSTDGKTTTRRMSNGTYNIVIVTTDGTSIATAKGADGKVVFEGPFTSDADKAKVPADLVPLLQQMQQGGQGGFGQGNFGQGNFGQGNFGQGNFGQGGLGQAAVNIYFNDPTAEMTTVLTDLSDDQKNQLKEKITAVTAAVNDFRNKQQTRMQELLQAGDQQALRDQRTALVQDGAEFQLKNEKELESTLTDAQKSKWEAYLFGKLIKQKIDPALPTQEQADKVDSLILTYAKDLVDAKDPAEMKKAKGSIYKKVLDDVLTDDQLGQLVDAQQTQSTTGGLSNNAINVGFNIQQTGLLQFGGQFGGLGQQGRIGLGRPGGN